MKKLVLLLFILGSFSCSTTKEESLTEQSAKRFFEIYKQREDWQGFQDLYADDLEFEDVYLRAKLDKPGFIAFYNWPDAQLEKHPDYPEVLVLEDLTFTDSTAFGKGYFTPFYYGGQLFADKEHMKFAMWLKFNDEGKIVKHIDFIEYPPTLLKPVLEGIIAQDSISAANR